ncbi:MULTISPECIES: extracellular solute-binding protein [unclassified Paenibacillus]|uniref:ABC transporter substrate-binding protein n=1 Tax=unclassified Paenibacillus TaxID=185978 RepID=UPI000955B4B1|nr:MULTISPECIES: extracellular solute-binding protein [unclassified Paenibacillus]ASS66602.1 extracellular solute-binding protein [Paenibacillus sp. RUD330]SIQ01224.1 raffinose/stachyose/melibiose transport system substrate-binding protein [Paenibacillus sp. RU4X]SIQ20454.1 raffinose/stachyose/melibiose transport system substrate-binding protein [Paenibacillus sp. RU4T]
MKKGLLTVMSAGLALSVMAGCSTSGGNSGGSADQNTSPATNAASNTGTSGGDSGKKVTLNIFQFKVEIADAMNRLKADYEKEHPNVTLNVETMGGGADYSAGLKAKFAAGQEPDIFNNGGNSELTTWIDKLEDLSDQPWAGDIIDSAKGQISRDGKLYGMPVGVEGYGFIYNKDLFAKAGITTPPKTLTELEEACKKLEAAGITPFSDGYQEWWVLGNHLFNVGLANQDDPTAFVNSVNEGKGGLVGNPVYQNWFKLFDLTLKYSNKNPLTTDYNTQVTLFASGKTAMMQQGNWTQVQIDGITPDMNIGLLPMPIDDSEKSGNIFVGVPNNWAINKNSKNKDAAKEFLTWLATSETGKKYIVNEFKFIPALKSIEVTDSKVLGAIANDIVAYNKEGKSSGWFFSQMPEGLPQEVGSEMQAYVAKKVDQNQLMQNIQDKWNSMSKK